VNVEASKQIICLGAKWEQPWLDTHAWYNKLRILYASVKGNEVVALI